MRTVALIGPAGAGKSTVGELLASILDRPFVDVDDVGERYYSQVGQPVAALRGRIARDGFIRAHRWWQPARCAATRVIGDMPQAVIAFGAGHSHFEDDEWASAAQPAFSEAIVVLLLPSRLERESVAVLRDRCRRDKDTDWIHDGHDYLADWVASTQNRDLADLVVHDEGRTPAEVARQIAQHSQSARRSSDERLGERHLFDQMSE